jgi:phage/plasmid-associated DNA primase
VTKWKEIPVDNEWAEARARELTPELATKLWETREFPGTPAKMLATIHGGGHGLGYMASESRWVLPLANIHGQIHQAKAWRQYYGDQRKWRWMTAGGEHARENWAKRGEPIGRVWDLTWLDQDWPPDTWLWVTAGEWDCITARIGGLPATCMTIGESASAHTINGHSLLVEFGGPEIAQQLLGKFKGAVIVYDADGPGDKGAVLMAGALEQMCDEIDLTTYNMNWRGIRAINLRDSPLYPGSELGEGWDFSNFVKAAKANGGGGLAWLREMVDKSPVGKVAIAEMLDVDLEQAMVSGQIFVTPAIRVIELEDLLDGALQYARAKDSRAQGAYHMGLRAEDGGWTYDLMVDHGAREAYLDIINRAMPKNHPFTVAEFDAQLKAAMQGTRRPDYLDNDLANLLRIKSKFNFFRWHDIKGCMYWDGVRWTNGRLKFFDTVDKLPNVIDEEAAVYFSENDQDSGKRLKKWANTCRKTSGKLDKLYDMASKRSMFRPRSEIGQAWDVSTHIIGTPGGILKLTDGQHLQGSEARDAYCSHSTRGSLVSRDSLEENVSECWAYWDKLLSEWLPDEASRRTLQEVAGTCLVGVLDEHLWLLRSSGRSGKSTFLDALAMALGDYAYAINGSVLASTAGDNPKSSAMAQLDGKRMTVISEIGGQKLDIEVLKQITGERDLQGRALRIDWTTVRNHSTFMAMANLDLNLHNEQSEALRGRLYVIDWPQSYVDSSRMSSDEYSTGVAEGRVRERDDRVKTIVRGEDPEYHRMQDVVFSWMFEGWERVRAVGHPMISARILKATGALWTQNDAFAGYFGDENLWAKGGETLVSIKGLWNNMRDWATRTGDSTLYEVIGDKAQVLSTMFKQQGSRGFTPMGRVGKPAKPLWIGEDAQCQGWIVPYTYIGSR